MSDKFKISEKFVSIDGEGPTAGMLSTFVRFAGCNLRCRWCDTSYAWRAEDAAEELTAAEIAAYVKSAGINHVTLTGGEPLLQPGLMGLLSRLTDYEIHIETNGSLPFDKFRIGKNVHFVVDYKLPASGEEGSMLLSNFASLRGGDALKFVAAGRKDLERAVEIIDKHALMGRAQIFFSCVFGELTPAEAVDFMKEHGLCGVRLQLQLHKYIWNKDLRGV